MGNHVLRIGSQGSRSIDQELEIISERGRAGDAVAMYGLAIGVLERPSLPMTRDDKFGKEGVEQ